MSRVLLDIVSVNTFNPINKEIEDMEYNLTITGMKELIKWLEKYLGFGSQNPFKIALALKGLRQFDEEYAISFLTSNKFLKRIVFPRIFK